MRKLLSVLGCLITIHALSAPASGDSGSADCENVISQARGAYYNLKQQGFGGFKSTIEPDWEVILGPISTPHNLKIFRALRFSMVADANGTVTVTHEIAESEKGAVEAYVKDIHGNVQRLVAAFFGAWSRFTIISPFPENETSFRIDDSAKQCRLFFTTESTDIVLTVANDLVVTEWTLTGARSKRTIKPRFKKTSAGLLLEGYNSLSEPVGAGIKTELEFTIEHQEVDGLKLPHRLEIRGTHGGVPVAAELRFNQYVLTPRPTPGLSPNRIAPQFESDLSATLGGR